MTDRRFDVVVIGGGPAGTMAAIASARHGMKTLIVERNGFLGGMLTSAGVGPQMSYHAGNVKVVRGIADEMVERLVREGFSPGHIEDFVGYASSITPFDTEGMKTVLENMVLESGAQILYHTVFTGCSQKEDRIESVRLFSKCGYFNVYADFFIDCSSDAELAADAGVPTVLGDGPDTAIQPMTMMVKVYNVDRNELISYMKSERSDMLDTIPFDRLEIIPRTGIQGARSKVREARKNGELGFDWPCILCFETNNPGEFIINVSHIFDLSPLDPFDLTRAEIRGRKDAHEIVNFMKKHIPGFENCIMHSTGPQVGIRESRRIKGLYRLTGDDLVANRMFPDAVAMGGYPIDVHKKTDLPGDSVYKLKEGSWYSIPYRSLVTKEIKNLAVAGKCISMDRQACGAVRVTPIVMALGQAAGTAAYLCLSTKKAADEVDTEKLRKILKSDGVFLEEYR